MRPKKALIVLTMLFASVGITKAGHFVGAEIYYEFVGDSATHNRYVINLILYQDGSGPIPAPSAASVGISSSCFPNSTVSLPVAANFSGGVTLPSFNRCFSSSGGGTSLKYALYQDTVTLAGTCADWVFSFVSLARTMTNGSSFSDDYYVMARLDNRFSQNSTPVFNDPIKLSCVNGAYSEFVSDGLEPDNDSLVYRIVAPLSTATTTTTYTAGFSPTHPINTTPTDSFRIDSTSGLLTFTPSQTAVSVYAIEISEYRQDTGGVWIEVGSMRRDLNMYIGTCDTTVTNVVSLFVRDTLSHSGFTEISFPCNSNTIVVPFRDSVNCASIEPSGSDFTIFSVVTSSFIPITSAQATTCNDGLTLGVTLTVSSPLNQQFDHVITAKQGNDANIVFNACGFEYAADTIVALVDTSTFSPVEFLDTTMSGATPEIDFACGGSIIVLPVDRDIVCTSIAKDGTDFSITEINTGKNISVRSASTLTCVNGFATSVQLVVDTPITLQGDYHVMAKVGSDANTLTALCSGDMRVGETLILKVDTSCGTIGINEQVINDVKVYPNPSITGDFILDIEGDYDLYDLKVMDISGRQIYLKEINTGKHNLNVNLDKGVYLIVIESKNKSSIITKRVIVE